MVELKLDAKSVNVDTAGPKGGINAGVRLEGRLDAAGAKRLAELFRGLSERMKAAGADQDAVCKIIAALARLSEKAEKPDYFVLHLLRKIVPKELNMHAVGVLQSDLKLLELTLTGYLKAHGMEKLPEKSTRAAIEQLGNDLGPARKPSATPMERAYCQGSFTTVGSVIFTSTPEGGCAKKNYFE